MGLFRRRPVLVLLRKRVWRWGSLTFPARMALLARDELAAAIAIGIDMEKIAPGWIITLARLIQMEFHMQALFQLGGLHLKRPPGMAARGKLRHGVACDILQCIYRVHTPYMQRKMIFARTFMARTITSQEAIDSAHLYGDN